MANEFKDKATDIDASLSKNPITNDIELKKGDRAVLQHMELLIMRDEDAIIGMPGACAGLNSRVFEIFDFHEEIVVKNKIKNALKYEPRIEVLSIDLTFEEDQNELIIEIVFTNKDTDNTLTYRSTLKRVL